MVKDQNYWLQKLATLRIDRARGNPAPHKPLLLLVIIEMMEKAEIRSTEVTLSPDIAFRFSVYWSAVAQRCKQRPDVRLPFHHISSSGIWQALTAQGEVSTDKKLTKMIRINQSFFECLSNEGFRDKARRVLIETEPYFLPEERVALYSMLKMKPSAPEIREDEAAYKASVQTAGMRASVLR